MRSETVRAVRITAEAFLADPHATRYRDIVDSHPEAFARLLVILNDPHQQAQLLAAETYGRPALSGVVQAVEADECIAVSLASPASARFRQTVGVAVRLAMEAIGWSKTGRKGPVRGARYFRRAERYEPPAQVPPSMALNDRARAALRAIELVGDEEERARTATELLSALAGTRRAENRPF
ncbi:MAG: hypothetical protein ACR2HM_01215 [Acidimicrobiales bacterium]